MRQAGVIAIFAPLLIAARLRFPSDGKAYASLVDMCERYSVRVFLINERRGNAGSTRLYSLAHQLYHDGNLAPALTGVAERIWYFASDEETYAELINTHRNWYAKSGHKYFLYQYELHLLGSAAPAFGFDYYTRGEFKSSTTEHVLPQTPADGCWQTFSHDERARYTHCLGNLVLTNDNSVYSNHSFHRKRDGIVSADGGRSPCYATSPLRQEQELSALADWTPQQVLDRQKRLAQWAMKRWSINLSLPSSAKMVGPDEDDLVADTDHLLKESVEQVKAV